MQGMAPHFKTLANEAEIPLLAMAEKGSRVDQWSNRPELAAALIDFDPTHVLVSLGGNANAKADALLLGNAGGTLDHAALDGNGAFHCLGSTVESDEEAITHGLDHATLELTDGGIDDAKEMLLEVAKRPCLVTPH